MVDDAGPRAAAPPPEHPAAGEVRTCVWLCKVPAAPGRRTLSRIKSVKGWNPPNACACWRQGTGGAAVPAGGTPHGTYAARYTLRVQNAAATCSPAKPFSAQTESSRLKVRAGWWMGGGGVRMGGVVVDGGRGGEDSGGWREWW